MEQFVEAGRLQEGSDGLCAPGGRSAAVDIAVPAPAAFQPESGLDWNVLWLAELGGYSGVEDEGYWDSRSTNFKALGTRDGYADGFLTRAALRPGETVIDMGCGSGALTLPLAAEGHRVVACDLSGGMLDRLRCQAEADGLLGNLDVRKMSWLDSWDDLPVADAFFASRSLFSRDLRATLLKMEAHARRRVCATVSTFCSPRHDLAMLRAIGRAPRHHSEHVYLVNLLMQMGRLPELSYLSHVRPVFAADRAQVRAAFEAEDGPFTPEESERLDAFIEENYQVTHGADGVPRVVRSYDRIVHWAFVAWEPQV